MNEVGAVIVAAGNSTRMGGVDKIFAPLCGRPLLSYSLTVFETCSRIDRMVLVVAADRVEDARRALEPLNLHKLESICSGGGRRQDSVRAGLDALRRVDRVVIHDAARPLVTADLIE